ncbi:MAG: ParB N-terminal domain-containing protein [Myxococcales bacterium]|nr:ParB N-terminal domain-containing protein [Myxococcales bacterium]
MCLLEVSAPVLGEVCPYCGDGPAQVEAEHAAPEAEQEAAEQLRSDSAVVRVLLADIDLERSPKMRDELDQEAIALYAQSLDALPAIELVRIADGSLVIADGWHRYRAAEAAGASEIQAAIRDGSARDALMAALAANARHGVRRSRADLRVVVRAALRELGALSDRQLGPIIGVSDKTVAGVRAELVASGEVEASPRRGKDGKTRKLPEPRKPRTPAQRQESERAARERNEKREAEVEQSLAAADPSRVTVVLRLAESYPQAALARNRAEVPLQDGVRAVVQVKRHSVVLSFERRAEQ